jgi:DNA mismatch repair protein MutH
MRGDDARRIREERGMSSFDYETATADEIAERAATLVGRTLIELQPALAPMVPSSAATKGVVGRIYEACFDIPQNSIPGPDFPGAAIELKSVPILLTGVEARAKERISVGMIDFQRLVTEDWESASVRSKLDKMLLIFYGWQPLQPISRFKTLAAGVWSPDPETWLAVEADWRAIHSLVAAGRRSEVSESLTRVLGAATKGPGHGSISRAWSLKQPFVGWIFRSMTEKSPLAIDAIVDDPAHAFEVETLARLRPHVGRAFDVLAAATGRAGMGGKNAVATVTRALVGEPTGGRTGEFARFGIEVKTVPVDAKGRIVEAMSFPAFHHEELIYETWESSDLLGRLNRLLIVPVHREKGATRAETRLGKPFFWSPSEAELAGIATEWERFRHLIEIGQARDLPKPSETTYIHVRPKALNASDRDVAPGGFDVIKKCFWLNQSYVGRILAANDAVRPPRH